MAHSGNTTNFNLPQFSGTDHPSFTGDFNEAFLNLDNFLKDISTIAEQAQAAASAATEAAGAATTAAGTAQSAAEAAQSKADEAYDKASQGGGFDLDKVYPVGAIYMSMGETDPGTLFGGTWSKIEGRFLYAVEGESVPTGTTGGKASVSLTTSNMPSHSHSVSLSTSSSGNHNHEPQNGNSFVTCDSPSDSFTRNGFQLYSGSTNQRIAIVAPDSGIQSSGWYTASDGSHSHSVTGNTNSSGNGTAFDIMPPYMAVNCWQRTA